MHRKLILVLIATGFIIYFNSLFNSFVWDDEEQILNNTPVHSIGNLASFYTGSTFNTGGAGSLGGLYYKPLMTTVFFLLYSVFGPNAFYFHFFQAALHIVNTIIVFYILRIILKKELIAFFLSLIFLIHPINTESVAYIAALQEPLFFFFGSLALLSVIYAKWVILVPVSLLLSFLSKETGIIFVPIILSYLIIFRRPKKQFIIFSILCTGIYVWLRFIIAGIYFNKHGLAPISQMDLGQRLLSIPQIIFYYLKTFIFPKDLLIDQQWAVVNVSFNSFWLPLTIVLVFFGTATFLLYKFWRGKSPYFSTFVFFFVWFGVSLGLHLQIFPLDLTVAERWFYLPMIGILGMAGTLTQFVRVKNHPFIALECVILIFMISMLSLRTIIRNANWQNGLNLYGNDIKLSEPNFDLENNFGVELFRSGNMKDARVHFENSVKLAPNWWTNWNNLGVIYEKEGEIDKARTAYKKAGNYYLAIENLASLSVFHDDPKNAKTTIEKSLQLLPQNPKLWLYLAIAEYKLDNKDNALKAAGIAYRFAPQNKDIIYVYSSLMSGKPLKFK